MRTDAAGGASGRPELDRVRRHGRRGPSSDTHGRLRVVAYVVLAALAPIAIAAWAFAQLATTSEVEKADAVVRASAQAASREFGDVVEEAATRVSDLARDPNVKRAVAARDQAALARIASARGDVAFRRAGTLLAGDMPSGAVRREVDVVVRGRTVGTVVAFVPLDAALLERLADATGTGVEMAIDVAGRTVAATGTAAARIEAPPGQVIDVDVAGNRYRGRSVLLARAPETTLTVVASPRRVEDALAETRELILVAAAAALVGVALVAYALAPSIARGRLALLERTQAARVLSHVADGVFVVDRAGVITSWNPAAEAITGLTADDVRGRPAAEAIPGWSAIEPLVPVATAAGERIRPQVAPLPVAEGEVWISASGVRFSEGTVYAFRDLTEEHRVEELKSDFVVTASHELRTPVASMMGAALTLRAGHAADPETRDELLRVIAEQGARLARIVDELLLAENLISDTLPVAREVIDPVGLARGAVEAERPRVPAGASLELAVREPVPPAAGDSGKARQVLANLIDNALKYAPGGPVDVAVEARDGAIRFSVSDRGPGIPAGEERRIFEKFYRLDPAQTGGVGGTGLGLYICRELVERMGGRIDVEPNADGGSTFWFELPIARAAADAARRA